MQVHNEIPLICTKLLWISIEPIQLEAVGRIADI